METYTPPDPNTKPTETDVATLIPGDNGPHYPKATHHAWGGFALLAIEMGGYSDLEVIDPRDGRRLHTGGPDADHRYCNPGATEEADCPHKHGGRVGIMFNNPASNQYFHALRQRLANEWAGDPQEDHIDIYEQLRRLVDVMQAERFVG